MKKMLRGLAVVGLLTLGMVSSAVSAPTYKGPALETLSASVQKTVKDQLGGGAIVSIEREVEDGDIYYTIEMLKDGKARSVAVNEDGSLSSVQVFLDEIPAPVRKIIDEQLGTGKIFKLDLALALPSHF